MLTNVYRRARVSVRLRIRHRFPDRVVVRDVGGVRLAMPWVHRLADYSNAFPDYGRNLVDLAAALADGGPLRVVDVGANIGDSALQILDRVDARVLCVDGDPYWLDFLRRNTAAEPRVTVAAALIVSQPDAQALTPVRTAGTTHFVPGTATAVPQLTGEQLRASHPDFADVRLVKSDLDGFDARIVPMLAAAWHESAPVLFFEYDPALSRATGDARPEAIWQALADLGYTGGAVWDNFGRPLGRAAISALRDAASVLDGDRAQRGYDFWDVALAAAGDDRGHAALERLVPDRLPLG